ncbi:MAG: hypothetical protein D6719_00800 [Candidatus Dadabacteria bacterium]|nr:MAG: hypothetical protein D6719_00800 [Candidatus Dadabacteria bacterium]
MKKFAFFLSALILTSCSPFYAMRAVYEEGKILLARKPIPEVINDSATGSDERRKLKLVLKAREFARGLGLTPKDSFTMYTKINRDVLAWVLVGSKPDAFELYTWWFPFVGMVPYKGFFTKKAAERAGARLKQKGYEIWIRDTEAISTLGWFNDPLLSTTLRNHEVRVVNTVFHEIFHSTVWIPNHVDFNESLANFVGNQASIEFYENEARVALKNCLKSSLECKDLPAVQNRLLARRILEREFELAGLITRLYDELDALYKSDKTKEEKLKLREEIFNRHLRPFRARYPELKILKKINNAEIIQLKLYLTGLPEFKRLFLKLNKSWPRFIAAIKDIKTRVEKDAALSPWQVLDKLISARDMHKKERKIYGAQKNS